MATIHHLLLLLLPLLFLPFSSSTSHVSFSHLPTTTNSHNPFTAKAAAIRYWTRKVPNNRPHPAFLLSKLSPLSAVDSAAFSSSSLSTLSSRLPAFCAAARLLCSPSLPQSLSSHHADSHFNVYDNINFTNYGAKSFLGADSFTNYSENDNIAVDSFRRYSRDATGHDSSFAFYSLNGNVVTSNFTSYSTSVNGGSGEFSTYHRFSNVADVDFTNYDANANGAVRAFTSYADDSNAGDQNFKGYGKHGNGVPTTFTSYGSNSNVINSGFSGYSENGNAANDTFTSYGFDGNAPETTFKSYGKKGNGGVHTFTSYRDTANVGDDTFVSYAENENAGVAEFVNYGNSANTGSDSFKGYDKGFQIKFKSYAGDITNFQAYAKSGVEFKNYKNSTGVPASAVVEGKADKEKENSVKESGRPVNRWVEPGKFFRESSLKKGTVMPMPDIRDKMPKRSFLPRPIADKIPFSAEKVGSVFKILPDTAMGKAVAATVAECERAPSKGETKRCATSAEDMIDFAVSVLGPDIVVRSTESTAGSKGDILIGEVKGINGGKVTKSVSCHQSLFPYLVYYCHSVPEVRVYEAEILSVETKEKINRGVAICHIDTSDWSAGHGAFVALGSGPGKIEVCHWIFEGDMTWAKADR